MILPSHTDADRLLCVRSGHSDAAVAALQNEVVRARGRRRDERILRNAHEVAAGENREVHAAERRAGRGRHRALADDLRSRRRDTRGQAAIVIDRVLIHRIKDGVHVGPALRVASVAELLRGVDGHDDDRCQDGNDADHEEEFNEREPSSGTKRKGTHKIIEEWKGQRSARKWTSLYRVFYTLQRSVLTEKRNVTR